MMKKIFYGLVALVIFAAACNEKDDLGEAPRLFRPVIKGALEANGNWIKAAWQPVSGAVSYNLQISKDTFNTITASIVTDTNVVIVANLAWDRLYQVQVKAIAADTTHNSRIASLGAIKTARFPSILNVPLPSESNDNSVKVSWRNEGAAVTSIKILKASDSSVVKDVNVDALDISRQYKIVSGLSGLTNYIIFLYSGTTVRGWADFSTTVSLTGNLIDLREITGRPSVLQDTIPIVPSGSKILLKRGETYNISTTVNLNKSLSFLAGPDLLISTQPVITMPSNFNITAGSTIDSLVFVDIALRGTDYAAKYVFNINTACTIGKIRFESCLAEIFRGVLRTQASPAMIGSFEVEKCIMDSLSGYGVITVDVASSKADKIILRNSTFYKAEKIITSRNNSTTVIVENCTFNEAPRGGNYFIDYSTSPTNEVTQPISFKNNILGSGKSNAGNYDVRGWRAGANSSIDVSTTYSTSDFLSTNPTGQIPNVTPYAKPSTDIWQAPFVGNFKIVDNNFPGKSNSGDPRWRL
jgi:hypothetical protein